VPIQYWHSAGSLGWPFPMLKYQYIFQVKYTEAILSNSTRKLLWFEIRKMLIAVLKNRFIQFIVLLVVFFRTLSFPCGSWTPDCTWGMGFLRTGHPASQLDPQQLGGPWESAPAGPGASVVVAQRQGVGLAIKRSRVRSPARARLRTTTLGKLFTPMCLDANCLRCYYGLENKVPLHFYAPPHGRIVE